MSAQPQTCLTAEEYLEIERQAEYKSEFYAGEMFAMAGGSEAHNLIAVNVVGELRNRLKGGPCRVYTSDMRVRTAPNGLYTYPDISVVCDRPEFAPDRSGARDTLLNPLILFEVLSESTEAYDRGKKFELYRELDSLRQYVLIAQERMHVDYFIRDEDGTWRFDAASGPDAELALPPIQCTLPLAEIYDKVEFEPAASTSASTD